MRRGDGDQPRPQEQQQRCYYCHARTATMIFAPFYLPLTRTSGKCTRAGVQMQTGLSCESPAGATRHACVLASTCLSLSRLYYLRAVGTCDFMGVSFLPRAAKIFRVFLGRFVKNTSCRTGGRRGESVPLSFGRASCIESPLLSVVASQLRRMHCHSNVIICVLIT